MRLLKKKIIPFFDPDFRELNNCNVLHLFCVYNFFLWLRFLHFMLIVRLAVVKVVNKSQCTRQLLIIKQNGKQAFLGDARERSYSCKTGNISFFKRK